MKFYYEAHNKWGEPTEGEIEAGSEEEAAGKIRAAGLFAREINTERIGKAKYDQGAVSAGPTQTRVYSPQKDDIAELAAGTTHVDERGDPILPTAEELNSLRMTPLEEYAKQARPEDTKKAAEEMGFRPDPDLIMEAADREAAEATPGYVDQDEPAKDPTFKKPTPDPMPDIKPRALKTSYDDERNRQYAIDKKLSQAAAWESGLAKDLEGISTVLGLMNEWLESCQSTERGEKLPEGTPAVGGRTWNIYKSNLEGIVADLIKGALGRAAQRMPIERIVKAGIMSK